MEKLNMLRAMMILNSCGCYDVRTWEKFEETGMPPEAFLEEGPRLWEKIGVTENAAAVMSKAASNGWADRELEKCDKLGVKIITCRDAAFPPALLETRDAPILLYVRGRALPIEAKTVAVVGTRRSSVYGAKVAREFAARAAACGWNVVSGGAKGIDGAAHAGCVEAGGVTAAVLGTGVDRVYPAEHREMFGRIMERGALYSEYPLGTGGESWRFPRRNRIIAGLASNIIVAEAPARSGAMITARIALEENREVWAAPGRIDDERCAGSNRLIFDGATPLIDFDVFFGSPVRDGQKTLFDDGAESIPLPPLSENEKRIMSLLTVHGDKTIDNLAGEAKMSAADTFKIMSVLSLRGEVFASGPGRYRLKD
jgi:DNA processing protein